jgi:hypothetical protein
MTGNIQRWPDPDSRNERLVDDRSAERELAAMELAAVEPAARDLPLSTAAARPAIPRARLAGPRDHSAPGGITRRSIGRRRRARAAAACAAAATLATAGAVAATSADAATHAQPHAAAAWRIAKTVSGPHGPYFSTVTAVSGTSAWAFEAAQNGKVKPTAWHLAGGSWSQVTFPGLGGEIVGSAGATSAGNVWAFTHNQFNSRSRALHWNGSRWTVAGSFTHPVGGSAVIGAKDVWVFGSPLAFHDSLGASHYNGHRWVSVPSGHGLIAGSGLSAGNVWAVGGRQVAHWNGHTWSRTSVASLLPKDTPLSHSALAGIYAQSAASVWAVGTGGRQDEGGPTVLLHFNGHAWSKVVTGQSSDPSQVTPDGHGGLWIPVPGSDGNASRILHYSGGHLSTVSLPGGGGRKLNVLAVAHAPGSGPSFAAGYTHRKNNFGAGLHAVILQCP